MSTLSISVKRHDVMVTSVSEPLPPSLSGTVLIKAFKRQRVRTQRSLEGRGGRFLSGKDNHLTAQLTLFEFTVPLCPQRPYGL